MSRPSLVLATPFRLFFLTAGIMAAMWVPLWLLILLHGLPLQSNLGLVGWHTHEMVFGYTGAVLAGFLLTAARNWTKRETARGPALALLFVVWCAGRVASAWSASLPHFLPITFDALFWLGFAAALARPIIGARSWRNFAFPWLVLLLGACDAASHLVATADIAPRWSPRALAVALDTIILIIFIFGGRIIPTFTGNALGLSTRQKSWFDALGLAALCALAVLHASGTTNRAVHVVAIACGVLNAARLVGWRSRHTLGTPLLWVLHIGWLLACAGVALAGVSGFVIAVPRTAVIHLVTVGGIGVLTFGMMARVSLGHTGRKLIAARVIAVAFLALLVATAVRVIGPSLFPTLYSQSLWLAGTLWSLAFLVFSARYLPIFVSARPDGKPG